MPSYIGVGWLWAESAVDSRGVAIVVMTENGTYWKLADVINLHTVYNPKILLKLDSVLRPVVSLIFWSIKWCSY
jgi:hypothetical protein